MAQMIPVTGYHVAMCCPFCEAELLDGDPAVCLNADCFLFGYPAPIPVQRMLRDIPRGKRRTEASDLWTDISAEYTQIRAELTAELRRTSSTGPK